MIIWFQSEGSVPQFCSHSCDLVRRHCHFTGEDQQQQKATQIKLLWGVISELEGEYASILLPTSQQLCYSYNYSMASKSFSVGELVSFEWRLGISMQSNSCKNLAHPFVSVLLKVRDHSSSTSSNPGGNTKTYTIEMDLAQFQV